MKKTILEWQYRAEDMILPFWEFVFNDRILFLLPFLSIFTIILLQLSQFPPLCPPLPTPRPTPQSVPTLLSMTVPMDYSSPFISESSLIFHEYIYCSF